MNIPRKISDIFAITCQKLLKSVEVCLSSDKNNFDCFFETRCRFFFFSFLFASSSSSAAAAADSDADGDV